MKKKLLLLSFIEGAAVMAAELCGAKLLAPVFGSSLFVWASVMGITLGALATGYFFGGWVSGKSDAHTKNLFRILNAAALFLVLMPVLAYYAVPRISYLPFFTGLIMSTFVLLFLPVFFLGASSPLFILIQTRHNHLAGKVSGTVYAVSTAGGIFATFFSGFYLIPVVGLNMCLLLFGTGLFIANMILLKWIKPLHLFLFVFLGYLNAQFVIKNRHQLMLSDGVLGRVEVKDIVSENGAVYRVLTVNDVIQTEMSLANKKSVSEYVTMLDSLVKHIAIPEQALVLGLGGGLTANLLAEKNYMTDAVELDNRIIKAASDFFYLNKNVSVFYDDARNFLNTSEKKYALVLVDVFKGEEQPSHVLTVESLNKLKKNLTDSSLLCINWHGYTKGEHGLGTAILVNTLQSANFNVKLCSYSHNENYRNVMLVAALNELPRLPFELDETLEKTTLLNTDNFPLLEKYNAKANQAWRLSYLRYYQSKK